MDTSIAWRPQTTSRDRQWGSRRSSYRRPEASDNAGGLMAIITMQIWGFAVCALLIQSALVFLSHRCKCEEEFCSRSSFQHTKVTLLSWGRGRDEASKGRRVKQAKKGRTERGQEKGLMTLRGTLFHRFILTTRRVTRLEMCIYAASFNWLPRKIDDFIICFFTCDRSTYLIDLLCFANISTICQTLSQGYICQSYFRINCTPVN